MSSSSSFAWTMGVIFRTRPAGHSALRSRSRGAAHLTIEADRSAAKTERPTEQSFNFTNRRRTRSQLSQRRCLHRLHY